MKSIRTVSLYSQRVFSAFSIDHVWCCCSRQTSEEAQVAWDSAWTHATGCAATQAGEGLLRLPTGDCHMSSRHHHQSRCHGQVLVLTAVRPCRWSSWGLIRTRVAHSRPSSGLRPHPGQRTACPAASLTPRCSSSTCRWRPSRLGRAAAGAPAASDLPVHCLSKASAVDVGGMLLYAQAAVPL